MPIGERARVLALAPARPVRRGDADAPEGTALVLAAATCGDHENGIGHWSTEASLGQRFGSFAQICFRTISMIRQKQKHRPNHRSFLYSQSIGRLKNILPKFRAFYVQNYRKISNVSIHSFIHLFIHLFIHSFIYCLRRSSFVLRYINICYTSRQHIAFKEAVFMLPGCVSIELYVQF